MKDTVVVYWTKYGATKVYADWLREELECDIFNGDKLDLGILKEYKTIIFGGGLYAGGVLGLKNIADCYNDICNKNLILFTVGLADTKNKENTDNIKNGIYKVLNGDAKNNIALFFLRGSMDYSKLGFIHKTMMSMLKKMIEKKKEDEVTEEDKDLLATFGKKVDFKSRESILPIVNFIRES